MGGKEAVEFGVHRDERTDARVMACRGRRDLSFYPELAEAKEWSCHEHSAVAAMFWDNGWGVVPKIPNDGTGFDGVSVHHYKMQ